MITVYKNANLKLRHRCVRIDGRTYDLAYSKDARAFLGSGNFDHVTFPEGLNVEAAITKAADAADADSLTRTAEDVMELVDAICAMGHLLIKMVFAAFQRPLRNSLKCPFYQWGFQPRVTAGFVPISSSTLLAPKAICRFEKRLRNPRTYSR